MDVRPIRTDADLAWAIAEVTPYFDEPPAPGTPEADRFAVLSELIEAYENRRFAVEAADPVAFLGAFIAMTGRTQTDLRNYSTARRAPPRCCAGSGRSPWT